MSSPSLDKRNIQNIYPLSPMQTGMLLHTLTKDGNAYVMQMRLRADGLLDSSKFAQAWQKLVTRHDMFRTIFALSGAEMPLQVVLRQVEFSPSQHDLSHLSAEEAAKKADEIAAAELDEPFELKRPPLMRAALLRLTERQSLLLVTFHHVLMDGWCQGILHQELLAIYHALVEGKEPTLPPAPPYAAYIKWLGKCDKEKAATFWKSLISDIEAQTAVPGWKQPKGEFDFARHTLSLPKDLDQALRALGAASGASFNAVFETLWGLLMARYNNTNQAVFGMVVSGRPPAVPDIDRMIGLFINTVPLRIEHKQGDSFRSLLARAAGQIAEGLEHHHTPTAEIIAHNSLGHGLLAQAVAFENFPESSEPNAAGRLTLSMAGDFQGHTNYDLLCLVDPGEPATVHLKYNRAALATSLVEMLADTLLNLAKQAIANPDMDLEKLNLLPPQEQELVLSQYAQGQKLPLPSQTVVEILEAVAAEKGKELAIVAADGSLTYEALCQRANRLANGLLANGVAGKDRPVAVLLERDSWMLPSLLAVLKAGSAYVPIDPAYPEQRISFLLEDSGCAAVLTTSKLVEKLPASWQGKKLDVRQLEAQHPDTAPASKPGLNDMAYVIYTSGSTGNPKGVMVNHAALANFCLGFNASLNLPKDEPGCVAFIANYVFDASGRAIYPPLLRGGTVHVIDAATRVDGSLLGSYIAENNIDILDGTPTLCSLVLQAPEAIKQNIKLRHLICGGEPMRSAFPAQVAAAEVGNPTIHNVYGPTETTIDSTWLRIPAESGDWPSVMPVGRPLPNQRTYILDSKLRLLPAGAGGELCIAGAGVARGYLNRPDLDAEKFIPDPFAPGERMYRTGDKARWNSRGEIEFLGRMDNQVKIRGYRIEPEEIEKRLSEQVDIASCAVVARTIGANTELELVAYYRPKAADPGQEKLRAWLSATLPPHMVPGYFVMLDKLPLTATGKLDRKALPAPEAQAASTVVEPPANETEAAIIAAWSKALNRLALGRNDNFFDLGGHSLRAAQAALLTAKALKRDIPPTWVYLAPTPAKFASLLSSRDESAAGGVMERWFKMGEESGKKLFCLPPYGGSGVAYAPLHKALDGFCLVCLNYVEGAAGFAAEAAKLIEEIQPTGDILLLGYSGGGSFAFEAAKLLEARGRKVGKLVLVDSHRKLRSVSVAPDTIAREVDDLLRSPSVAVYLDSPTMRKNLRAKAIAYAQELYRSEDTGRIKADITLVQAAEKFATEAYEDSHGLLRSRSAWKDCTEGSFKMLQGAGTHDSVFTPPALEENIRLLRGILA